MISFRPLTAIEALDKELERLQYEMGQYEVNDEPIESPSRQCYINLMAQRDKIQNALIDLARNENLRGIR